MSGQIEFIKSDNQIDYVDICICIKGQNFEKTLMEDIFERSQSPKNFYDEDVLWYLAESLIQPLAYL